MVTFKFKLNKSQILKQAGSLSLQVIYKRKPCSRVLPFQLFQDEWEPNEELVIHQNAVNPRKNYLIRVATVLGKAKDILRSLIKEFELSSDFTSRDIIQAYFDHSSYQMLSCFISKASNQLIEEGRERTARAYRSFLSSFMEYSKGQDIPLESLTPSIIWNYERHLKLRNCTPNTISFYMRNGRAIYNRAVRERIIARVDELPFSACHTRMERTSKRAVDEKIIRELNTLDLSNYPKLNFSKDLFLLSFYFRGMPFVDLCFLKKKDINGQVLSYRRSKTGQRLEIKMSESMEEIINYYASKTENSIFLLPIIQSPDKTIRLQYESALRTHNTRLQRISEMMGLEVPLTSYVARHSWATIAKRKGIPISLISEALGHTNEKTTQSYLGSFSIEKLDEVNKLIITDLKRSI